MSWGQLLEIIKANREIAEEEAEQINDCPDCDFVPLKENERGEKLCPICGWTGR